MQTPEDYTKLFNLAIAHIKTSPLFEQEEYIPIKQSVVELFRHTRSMIHEVPFEDYADIYKEQIQLAKEFING